MLSIQIEFLWKKWQKSSVAAYITDAFLVILIIQIEFLLEKNGKNLVLHVKYVLQYTYLTFPNVLFRSKPFLFNSVLKSTAIDFIFKWLKDQELSILPCGILRRKNYCTN